MQMDEMNVEICMKDESHNLTFRTEQNEFNEIIRGNNKILIDDMDLMNKNNQMMDVTKIKKNSNEGASVSSTSFCESGEKMSKNKVKIDENKNRFNLRKRRNINYNVKTKKFEYEDDSDYEEIPKKKTGTRKNKKNKQRKISEKKTKDLKLKVNADPIECREFQLSGLLNWKNYETKEEPKKGESEYYEFEDICNTDLDRYAQDLQALLINPPWSSKAPNKWDFNQFKKLQLPLSKMKEGLIFVWTEKELISDIVYHFENQDIKYVENLIWVTLDPEKKDMVSSTTDPFNINNIFKSEHYKIFAKSHMTLLMFRKFLPSGKRFLELRHQRTGDAVFDYDDHTIPFYRPFNYIYRLIEILLPKANFKQGEPLRMMEVFSRKNTRRKGWIHITQK